MALGKDFFFIVRIIKALIQFFIETFGDDEDKEVSNHYGLIPPRQKKTNQDS